MKSLLSALFLISLIPAAKAQDTIRTITGKVIPATVKKITPYEVSYLKYRQPGTRHTSSNSSSTYSKMSTSGITEIVYANGKRDSMLPVLKHASDTGRRYFTQQDFFRLGEHDARLYFHRYKGAATGTFLATFPGSPALGLCVAIATSATRPAPRLFTYPNPDLLSNEDYKDGYAKKAHQIKAGKVWTNWGIGTVITLVAYLAINGSRAY